MFTNIVSSNPTHGKVYSIHHYVIKFVSVFSQDLTQILLKVGLNTLTLKGVSGNTDIFSLGLICSCEFKYN